MWIDEADEDMVGSRSSEDCVLGVYSPIKAMALDRCHSILIVMLCDDLVLWWLCFSRRGFGGSAAVATGQLEALAFFRSTHDHSRRIQLSLIFERSIVV